VPGESRLMMRLGGEWQLGFRRDGSVMEAFRRPLTFPSFCSLMLVRAGCRRVSL
jgi:hypothetical protein